jgi:hexokinase
VTTPETLDKLGLSYDADDIAIMKYICETVSNRAALLVSICTATLLERLDRPDTTIAVDGNNLFLFTVFIAVLLLLVTVL